MGACLHQHRNRTPGALFVLLQKLLAMAAAFYCLAAYSVPAHSQIPTPSEPITAQSIIQARFAQFPDWTVQSVNWQAIRSVYAANQYLPIWIGENGDQMDISGFVNVLNEATTHGLPAQNYHLQSIQQQLTSNQLEERVWLDFLLTDAFLKYVPDIGTGQFDPRASDQSWHIDRPRLDAAGLLLNVIRHGNLEETLRRLPPTSVDYRQLMQALQRYTRIRAHGGWHVLPAGPILKLGDLHPSIALLRQRLQAEGDLSPSQVADEAYFDAELEQALKRFQNRHGLDPDGAYGPETRKAANIPIDHRIAQIKLNLERQRWLPRQRGELHVEVNLVDFRLDVMESGKSILDMSIIIGTRDRSTPAFNNEISYMVINPEWNIPQKIAAEELVPEQIRDAGYFDKLDIKAMTGWGQQASEVQVNDINWQQWLNGDSRYRLVQRSGEMNSLGRIKFMFPNPFNVYLHDTPYQSLFDHRVRTFSHGCIRISRPIEFATTLLERLSGSDPVAIEDEINTGETKIIRLPKPVPVYLIYKSAWVDGAGLMHFRNDVYNRDRRMMSYVTARSEQL